MVYTGVVLGTDFQETPLNEAEIKQRRKFVSHVKYLSLSQIRNKTSVDCRVRWLIVRFGVSGIPLNSRLGTS